MALKLRYHILLLIFFALANLELAQANLCSAEFAKPLYSSVKMGDEVPVEKLNFSLEPGSRAFFLGEGMMGGTVHRVIYPSGQVFIYKRYQEAYMATTDFDKLDLLYQLSQEPGYQGFKVIEPILKSGTLVIMGDVRGRTLKDLIAGKEKSVTEETLKSLKEKYNSLLERTFQSLKNVIPNLKKDGLNERVFIFEKLGGRNLFYLHEDNVVVTPDGQMIVIDPY